MVKRRNPFAIFFDYTWKYIWPVLIEGAIIGLGFLFVYFDLHVKMFDWVNKTASWLADCFVGINKYFWGLKIAEWGWSIGEGTWVGVLLFLLRAAIVVVGLIGGLIIQGVVDVLAAVFAFVVIVLVFVLCYVIALGIVYVFPSLSVLFAIGITIYFRHSEGVEYPVLEGILFAIYDVIFAIGGLVLYYIFLPL